MKLTPAILAAHHPSKSLYELANANCSKMGIAHIEDISAAVNLHKLDLTDNAIKKADALSGLKYNKEITWLNLKGNGLESADGVQYLEKLLVLNLSHNEVNRISHHIASCKELKALILNHNRIKRIENMTTLKQLNTIVLSHNQIPSLEGLGALPNLVKLSVAHNQLRQFPDLRALPALKELRLNDNKIISIADHVRFLPALEILDVGNNLIRSLADVTSLASVHCLNNLTLKGNPLMPKDTPEDDEAKNAAKAKYRQSILTLCPTLRVLDTERFDAKFLERRTKRKALEQKKQIKEVKEKRKIDQAEKVEVREKRARESDGPSSQTADEAGRKKTRTSAETIPTSETTPKRKRLVDDSPREASKSFKKDHKAAVPREGKKQEGKGKADLKARKDKKEAKAKRDAPSSEKKPVAATDDSFFLAEAPKPDTPTAVSPPAASTAPSSKQLPKTSKPEKAAPATPSKPNPFEAKSAELQKSQPRPTKAAPAPPPQSGVLAVVEVKQRPQGKKVVVPDAFDPSELLKPVVAKEEGSGLMVGGWD